MRLATAVQLGPLSVGLRGEDALVICSTLLTGTVRRHYVILVYR